jgi:hypothetical protein
MKYLIAGLILLNAVTVNAGTAPPSKDVTLTISEVYVPEVTSPAANAFVVLSGLFPNSCYSWKGATVTSPTPMVHEIKSVASVVQQMCLMVMIPYQKEVFLGRLQQGSHTLRFVNGDGTFFERTLTVE